MIATLWLYQAGALFYVFFFLTVLLSHLADFNALLDLEAELPEELMTGTGGGLGHQNGAQNGLPPGGQMANGAGPVDPNGGQVGVGPVQQGTGVPNPQLSQMLGQPPVPQQPQQPPPSNVIQQHQHLSQLLQNKPPQNTVVNTSLGTYPANQLSSSSSFFRG